MFHSFQEIEEHVLAENTKKIVALCGSHDPAALEAVVRAHRRGFIDAILIGDAPKTHEMLQSMGENSTDYEIVEEANEIKSARLAFKYVKEGRADIPMKGLMQTQSFMMAVLYPGIGVMPKDGFLSQTMVFHFAEQNRLVLASDCALNVSPSLDEKVRIIENAVKVAYALGIEGPHVAALSAVEKTDPTIVSSVEAEKLAQMDWEDDFIVEGPFALDNAIAPEAAKHKSIGGKVAGNADVLLMPDLVSGNVLYKSIHFFAHLPSLSVLCGTTTPAVLTSRTDTPETKYYSILMAVLQSA